MAIAGSGLASGDFRLKELIAPLEKADEKAPVFANVAQAIQAVVDSDSKSGSAPLFELSTLVTAILYTQGKTGAEGRLKAIETSDMGMPTSDSSARVLKPLIEALTTTGSGRMEIIQDAYNRGAFKDLRLVKPAVAAIDDVDGEIGDFVTAKVLPIYGKAILPELRASYDVKGKSGHVRRLRLMHQLDADGTQDLVETALESGSKEMKVAAISCLKDSKGHLSYMLEQTRAKAKDVRRAAFGAIARFTAGGVIDTLIKALFSGDVGMVAGAVSKNRSPALLKYLLEEAQAQLDNLLTTKNKAKLKTALPRFYELLGAFSSRKDKKSEQFLIQCFQQREVLGRLSGTSYDGEAINYRVASMMAQSDAKSVPKTLVDAHESLPPSSLGWALVAVVRTRKPKEVFNLFSPYYTATAEKKRGRNPVKEQGKSSRRLCANLDVKKSIAISITAAYIETASSPRNPAVM
ncbi:MAG: hypothetical protein CMJ78_06015 [Planctomycetaceae bacterium]|nr:hypothetical protein [Planctomycetaceae bacterium]